MARTLRSRRNTNAGFKGREEEGLHFGLDRSFELPNR